MSNKLKKEIKPCPFCGHEATMFYNPRISKMIGTLPMIVCDGCKATVSFGGCEHDEKGAIKRFNHRVSER